MLVTLTHPIANFTGVVTVLEKYVLPFTSGTASIDLDPAAFSAVANAGITLVIGAPSPAPAYDANLDAVVAPIVTSAASTTSAVLKGLFGTATIVTGAGVADSAAVLAAFNAMKVGGHATGRLVLKGTVALDSAVVLDGGYANPGNNFSGGAGEQFVLDCSGAHIVPAANLGAALTVRNFYGARIDARFFGGGARRKVTDAAITSGQATLTSATAAFASTDVGKFVRLEGASTNGEAPLCARINSVTNATTAVLNTNAAATVSGAACTIMDIGLALDSLVGANVALSATGLAGLALHIDDAGNNGTAVHQSTIREVKTTNCGMGLFLRANVGDFGQFADVWDDGNTDGVVVATSADVTFQYFENFSPATQTVGILFDHCSEAVHVKELSLGDRATEALAKIVNTGGNDSGPTIDEIYVTGYMPGANPTVTGVKVVDSGMGNLGLVHSNKCAKVLHSKGGGVTARIQSSGSDGNVAYIEGGHSLTTPKVDLTLDTFFSQLEPVVVTSSITGGYLKVRGTIDTPNNLGDASKYLAVNCAAANMVVDVSGLREFGQGVGAGSLNHADPTKIRGVDRSDLSKPGVWGSGPTTWAGFTAGTNFTNSDPRTMWVTATINMSPTAGNDAFCTVSLGPQGATFTQALQEVRRIESGNTQYAFMVPVPSGWLIQIALANATVNAVKRYYL